MTTAPDPATQVIDYDPLADQLKEVPTFRVVAKLFPHKWWVRLAGEIREAVATVEWVKAQKKERRKE